MSDEAPEDTMDASTLDGYLGALASGPTRVMPDQILPRLWHAERSDDKVEINAIANLIIRQYQDVNDALNDKVYVPRMKSPPRWCRGYLAGFASDMILWAPLTTAQPDLLKVLMKKVAQMSRKRERVSRC